MKRFLCAVLFVCVRCGFAWADCAENEITLSDGGCVPAYFTVDTVEMAVNGAFTFTLSAAGTFWVDCGYGGVLSGTGVLDNKITRSNTTNATYTCSYSIAGVKTIRFGGAATEYTTVDNSTAAAAISFRNNVYVAGINGSLGAIFSTLENGSQPRFYSTFSSCTKLTGNIPEKLFDGIYGVPVTNMFRSTFYMDSGLTGSIPSGLFSGLNGPPANGVFYSTFNSCSGLTGTIPKNLFAGLDGSPAENMFYQTFNACSGLTGSIPAGLFRGIVGAPATSMFRSTFQGCSGLTGSIPGNLFAGISGAAAATMFYNTFYNCSGLTGYVPAYLFANITSGSTTNIMRAMFSGTGLSSSCPYGTTTYTTGWESYFSGTSHGGTFVACKKDSGCEDGYLYYNNDCYEACRFAENLHVGDIDTFSMFATLPASVPHFIVIKVKSKACYVLLEAGDGRLNVQLSDGVYHAVSVDDDI